MRSMREGVEFFVGDGRKGKPVGQLIFYPHGRRLDAVIEGFDGVREPLRWRETEQLRRLLWGIANRVVDDLMKQRRRDYLKRLAASRRNS